MRTEQPQRAFEYRANVFACFQHIDWMFLHQILEAFSERGFSAANRAKEVENLPLLLEALCGVLEVAHDALDRVFHAEEAVERLVGLDGAIEEDAAEAAVLSSVDQFGFADRGHHALRRGCVEHLVVPRGEEPVAQAHRFKALARVIAGEDIEDVQRTHRSTPCTSCTPITI